MSPYLIAANPKSIDKGQAVAEGGRRIAELAVAFGRMKDQRDREREEHALKLERLEKERRKAEQEVADVEGAVQGIQEEGARATDTAGKQGFQSAFPAMGMLGPFGLVTAGAKGAAERVRMEAKVAHDVEVAKRMSPEGARAHLAGRKALYAREALTTGYQAAQKMIERGGDPDGDAVLKPDEVQELNATLQTAIAEGESADGVIREVGKRYRLYGHAKQRLKNWDEADKQVPELLALAQQLADQAPVGIDPRTGKNAQAEAAKRLADAQAEWTQTEFGDFRLHHDPDDSLAALKKMLLVGEAETDPGAFIQREHQEAERAKARGVSGSQQEAYEKQERGEREELRERMGGRPTGRAGMAQEAAVPAKAQGFENRSGALQKPVKARPWTKLKPADQKGLEDELMKAARAGAPIRERFKALGLDPESVPKELQARLLKALEEGRAAREGAVSREASATAGRLPH